MHNRCQACIRRRILNHPGSASHLVHSRGFSLFWAGESLTRRSAGGSGEASSRTRTQPVENVQRLIHIDHLPTFTLQLINISTNLPIEFFYSSINIRLSSIIPSNRLWNWRQRIIRLHPWPWWSQCGPGSWYKRRLKLHSTTAKLFWHQPSLLRNQPVRLKIEVRIDLIRATSHRNGLLRLIFSKKEWELITPSYSSSDGMPWRTVTTRKRRSITLSASQDLLLGFMELLASDIINLPRIRR
jgi:hypothetical protein